MVLRGRPGAPRSRRPGTGVKARRSAVWDSNPSQPAERFRPAVIENVFAWVAFEVGGPAAANSLAAVMSTRWRGVQTGSPADRSGVLERLQESRGYERMNVAPSGLAQASPSSAGIAATLATTSTFASHALLTNAPTPPSLDIHAQRLEDTGPQQRQRHMRGIAQPSDHASQTASICCLASRQQRRCRAKLISLEDRCVGPARRHRALPEVARHRQQRQVERIARKPGPLSPPPA